MRCMAYACLLVLLASCASSTVATQSVSEASDASEVLQPEADLPLAPEPNEESAEDWFRQGAQAAAARGASRAKARNLILFVGDGMSLPTVAAARILEGQRAGRSGEEHQLAWERFPATAFSKTYNTDAQTPDSAGTMTAMASGLKTRAGVIGIGQQASRGDCAAASRTEVATLWELAAASGLATGVVTTTRVTHATPAATFTHAADRNWENDADLPDSAVAAGCRDIAAQWLQPASGRGPDVLLGGGRQQFLPTTAADPEYPDTTGKRSDGRDLMAEWRQRHPRGHVVWNAQQLAQAPATGPLLGLFQPSHMHFEHDRADDAAGEPSLAEMTRAAIERLASHPDGYVLLVEAGRIDHAHHQGNAFRALSDTIALSDAVRMADRLTSRDDTLILVTADHSHTLTFAGYPMRGNPILGKVKGSSGEDTDAHDYVHDALGLPYTTLGYANGPGYAGASREQPQGPKHAPHAGRDFRMSTGRPDLTEVDTEHPDYLQEATLPLSNETHGGDDVGIWARGPGSHAVRGTMEQNVIFHILLQSHPRLRQSLCDAGHCDAAGIPVRLPPVPSTR